MIHLIPKYTKKYYVRPACFALVAEFYIVELNFDLGTIDIKGETIQQLQTAFALSILKDNIFELHETPSNGDMVLLYKNHTDRPDHCGVWVEGKVLHASKTLVLWDALSLFRDCYTRIEFRGLHGN